MSNLTVDQAVEGYVKLRDQKKLIASQAEEQIKGLEAKMQKIEAWIKEQADQQGVTSFRTNHGTAFLTTVDYASVADWDAVLEFIQKHDAYDMLEKRVSKNAVRGYITEHKAVPPGVNYGTRLEVNVRKPGQKADGE